MRRLLMAILVIALAGGLYLGIGGVAWASQTAVTTACMELHGDQTPATFDATWGSAATGDLRVVDATPYRFKGAREVSFQSLTPGLTLGAWWAPPTAPGAGAVIVVHGTDSCRHDPAVLLPAGMVHSAGFGVLLVDLRDHGTSGKADGHWSGGVDEWQDVLGAWHWLRDQGYAADSIGLLGLSMGAASSAYALGAEPHVAAAWLDSSYASLLDTALATTAPGPNLFIPAFLLVGQTVSGVDQLGASPERELKDHLAGRPVAIVHGSKDHKILVDQAQRLADAAAGAGTTVKPWIVAGAEHVESAFVEPTEYARRVAAFFRATLQPRG